jgi:hypothetical protein
MAKVIGILLWLSVILHNFLDKAVQQCVRKVAVHLYKVLEVMSKSVYTGLNTFNFIRKLFLQICVRKVAVHL